MIQVALDARKRIFDWHKLQAKIAEAGIVHWAWPASIPMKASLGFHDWLVVDAGMTIADKSPLIELPIFVSITAEPVSRVVPILISEPQSDPVVRERPKLVDQPIFQFAVPFTGKKLYDFFTTLKCIDPISPSTVCRIAARYIYRIASIPRIFASADFLVRRVEREGWARRPLARHISLLSPVDQPTY
jgi:hypothetical protein